MSDLQRIGDDVRRLGRVPAVDPMVTSARSCWHAAVGDQVAANSLPARRSGDALVVHCASSAWASELTLLERHVLRRLSALMDPAPARLRFEVGDVEAPDLEPATPPRPAGEQPGPRERAQAAELAGAISDPELRRAVERAIAAGLARDL